jgi:cellobiose phosphorylase
MHATTPAATNTYKVEPYIIAADVYAVSPHTGRGGWTWYTGSAGWMYRLLTETLLGLNREGNRLRLTPRFPKAWTTCKIHYRYRQTPYHISISRASQDLLTKGQIVLDGDPIAGDSIPLVDDGREHNVEMAVG